MGIWMHLVPYSKASGRAYTREQQETIAEALLQSQVSKALKYVIEAKGFHNSVAVTRQGLNQE